MGDIDPTAQAQDYTPRQPTLVDAVLDARRIADAQMRSNPLRNAKIDDGRMEWRGNYAGGVGSSFLWIGEFSPNDRILNKPQRGFILTRDDSKHSPAFWMYDPFPDPAKPLRQLIRISDADGASLLIESREGGVQFPWTVIPMYDAQSDNVGNGTTYRSAINASNGSLRTLFRGAGPMTGGRVRCKMEMTTTAGQTLLMLIKITFSDNTVYTSPGLSVASVGFPSFDLDLRSLGKAGMGFTAEVQSGVSVGGLNFTWLYMIEFSIYGA